MSAFGVRVGCDVQEVDAVADAVASHGQRYLDRVYTRREQALSAGRAESLAGRFAAKEALLKALGEPVGRDLREIEVDATDTGRPVLRLSGDVATRVAAAGLSDLDVSISHTGSVAFAVVVGVQNRDTQASRA